MKFAKYLAKRHLDLPEYAPYLIDYKGMKKLIKQLASDTSDERGEESRYERLQHNRSTFFFQLERELEKITTFYNQKQSELSARLDTLIQKRTVFATGAMGAVQRDSIAYISLHEGLQRFRRDLRQLEQFVELNATGFSKVLKKWDKQSRSNTKELYLSSAIEVQPMFNREELVRLSDISNACLMQIEQLSSDNSVIFETERIQPYPVALDDASHDFFQEFMNFAKTYVADDPEMRHNMDVWLLELTSSSAANTVLDLTTNSLQTGTLMETDSKVAQAFNPPSDMTAQHITRLLLRALPTLASDDSIMALWNTGLIDVTMTDEVAQRSILHLCASYNHLSKEAVSEKSMGTCAPREITRTAIFKAALASKGIDVNTLDAYGRTALHCLAIHNRRDFLKDLFEYPIEVNRKDADNLTALHYSIFHNYLGLVEDLLQMGASTSGSDLDAGNSYIPLNFACQHGAYNAAVLLLRMRSDDPMIADAEGLFPLHIVARAGYASFVPLLVNAGADVDLKDKLNGWTPLIYASSEGNPRVVAALLEANASHLILDDEGRSALFYAAWEGHPSCLKQLSAALGSGAKDISHILPPGGNMAPEKIDATILEDMNISQKNLVDIPDLMLPPPIMPLKRYGHNFLDSKKIILQLRDVSINFYEDRRGLSAGHLTIATSSTKDSIPRNLELPVPPAESTQTFEIYKLEKFSLTFEVLPTFGTKPLGKAVAPASIFSKESFEESSSHRIVEVVLMNPIMRPIGTLRFSFVIVKPYPGRVLDVQKYDTYWKSTLRPVPSLSFVTASSLHGTYRRVEVTLTKDLRPIIMDMLFNLTPTIQVPTALFTYDELTELLNEKPRLLEDELADGTRMNIHVKYPTICESVQMRASWAPMNDYVDGVLRVVFNAARLAKSTQSLVFSTSHPEVCAMLNWKQPNYPVLFCAPAMRADGRYTSANRVEISETPLGELEVCKSLREACNYASTNNIMGIVAPADILALVPAVIPSVRAMGLVLVAEEMRPNEVLPDGVDGTLCQNSLEFPNSVDM